MKLHFCQFNCRQHGCCETCVLESPLTSSKFSCKASAIRPGETDQQTSLMMVCRNKCPAILSDWEKISSIKKHCNCYGPHLRTANDRHELGGQIYHAHSNILFRFDPMRDADQLTFFVSLPKASNYVLIKVQ